MPENLQQEMPQLREAFAELGVASWHSPGNEADDLAATLAAGVAGGGHQVTIVSTDKGYCQLLAPNVQIRDYFQKRWLDMPFVQQEFGVQPQQLPDYWGWRGSAAARSPAWRVSGQNRRAAVAAVGQPDGLYQHRSRCRRNGAASWSSTASWPTSANRWPRCAPICRWTVTCSSCACRYRRCKQRPLSGLTRLIALVAPARHRRPHAAHVYGDLRGRDTAAWRALRR